jgi:hypothetical protein
LLKEILVNEVSFIAAKAAMSRDPNDNSFLRNRESPVGQLSEDECPTIGIHYGIFRSVLNDDGTTTRIEHLGHGPKTLAAEVVQFRGSRVLAVHHKVEVVQNHLGRASVGNVCTHMGPQRRAQRWFLEVLSIAPMTALHTRFPISKNPVRASARVGLITAAR